MIRPLVIGVLLFAAAVLQTALFPHLAIAGYRPDLLLLLTALFALNEGPATGTGVGFAAGLLGGLLGADAPLGVGALVLMVTGYLVGVARPRIPHDSAAGPLMVSFTTGLLATGGYALLARLLGNVGYTALALEASLMVGLYNTLLTPAVQPLIRDVTRRVPAERMTGGRLQATGMSGRRT